MILEATAQASDHPQVPAGSAQLRGLERVLRPDPPHHLCNRVSRAVAEGRSRVRGAAVMPG